MVKAISFDVGETLLRPYPGFGELVVRCCALEGEWLGPNASSELEHLADAFFADLRNRGVTYSCSEEQSRKTWTTLYIKFLERQGVHPSRVSHLADRLYLTFTEPANYRLFDDAQPVLDELRQRGFRIGIISNWEAWLTRLLAKTGLNRSLHFQAISGLVGSEKPSRQIFEAAVADAGLPPDEILHVGDSLTSDVQGAEQAGLQAILLDRRGHHQGRLANRVETLLDLLDLSILREPS
jgi:putative hydrolase of the HAD superfamily